MKSKVLIVLTGLILATAASAGTAAAQGESPSDAIPIGQSITTRVECGARAGSMEPYEGKLAVLEVVRGKEAWERVKAASASNPQPASGFEYVLARIEFEMKAILKPGDKTFELARGMQFMVLSTEGDEQDPPEVTPPEPVLHRTVRAGEAAEGWIVLAVEQSNKNPVMFFDPAAGGAMGGGKIIFFKLY